MTYLMLTILETNYYYIVSNTTLLSCTKFGEVLMHFHWAGVTLEDSFVTQFQSMLSHSGHNRMVIITNNKYIGYKTMIISKNLNRYI